MIPCFPVICNRKNPVIFKFQFFDVVHPNVGRGYALADHVEIRGTLSIVSRYDPE